MPTYHDDHDELEIVPQPIQLGGLAPDFEAETTQGVVRLSTWEPNKWVLFFSHPADFTPVCTTEFVSLAKRQDDFEARQCALLGLSVDSLYSHIAWLRQIRDHFGVTPDFPLIADRQQRIARLYGMIHTPTSETSAVRSLILIDPARHVRAMIHYPPSVGRSDEEVLRLLDALQASDAHGVECPANWRAGQPAVAQPPTRFDADEPHDPLWFLRMKELEPAG